jgi:hypothetical protein
MLASSLWGNNCLKRPPTKERRRSSAGAIKEETSGHLFSPTLEETMRPLKKSAASKDLDN